MTETDIPPGGEGKIEVTFNTGRKKGMQKKTITVESNDPVNPKTRLHVSALIEVKFGFESYSLDFGDLHRGETATKTADLVLKDQSKRSLLELSSESPFVAVETTDSSGSDMSQIEVQVTVDGTAPEGPLNETIVAKLADNSHPPSNLRIRGSIIGNVKISPKIIRLTADTSESAANQAERTVRVIGTRSDFKFELLGVSDPRELVHLEVDTIASGTQYVIKAKPTEKALKMGRNLAGEIKVLTSDKEQPEVTFRYSIVFPRR